MKVVNSDHPNLARELKNVDISNVKTIPSDLILHQGDAVLARLIKPKVTYDNGIVTLKGRSRFPISSTSPKVKATEYSITLAEEKILFCKNHVDQLLTYCPRCMEEALDQKEAGTFSFEVTGDQLHLSDSGYWLFASILEIDKDMWAKLKAAPLVEIDVCAGVDDTTTFVRGLVSDEPPKPVLPEPDNVMTFISQEDDSLLHLVDDTEKD